MLSISTDVVRRLRIPGYVVMTMLTALPIIELAATAWPPQFSVVAWRFSVVGVAGATAITTVIGLFFIYAIALIAGDRAVLWVVSGLCAAFAILCIGAGAMFPLDALQMRGQVRPEALSRFSAASMVAMVKICAAALVYGALAVSSFRAGGSTRAETSRDRNTSASRLVVGQATPVRTGTN